ncbi:MAG: PIN domain-containing protein [Actinomycetales bacterium]|nr:PIN domain-containing protein [Actinomycetales bacterium]
MPARSAAPLRGAYLDSSALVKLVVAEPQTLALRTAILHEGWDLLVSSALAHTEVLRAVAIADPSAAAERRARAVLAAVLLLDVTAEVLDHGASIQPSTVRSLDALHVATAELAARGHYPELPSDISALVTYDVRMARAWRAHHTIPARAPGAALDTSA